MQRTIGLEPHGLPVWLSTFVGREREVAELRQLLTSRRLVTLVGAGGVGKTRLAVRVATDILGSYPDGVSFVDLAPVRDAALLPQVLLIGLGAPGLLESASREAAVDYLRMREALIVLDNCEHLVSASADLVDGVLCACPMVRVLATSREPLGVEGEVTWRVPSLLWPEPTTAASIEQLATCEAVQLFVERASLVLPKFALTSDNGAAVAEVCRRLDGIPLALELAAARLRVLRLEHIARSLDDDLSLLVGGSRTAPPRHQTLRATLDWSHGLLGNAERALFRRLAVFVGGFTLDAVEAVCTGAEVGATTTLDLLTALVDKSLVVSDPERGEARYRLLETVRQYAQERLAEADETARVLARHAVWYLTLAERALPELTRKDQLAWYRRLTADRDNLRLALEWSKADPDGGDVELRLAAALGRYWTIHGPLSEGRGWLEDALTRGPAEPTAARATALNWAGLAAMRDGDVGVARNRLEASVAVAHHIGNNALLTIALRHLSVALYDQDAKAGQAVLEEALAIARTSGNAREIAYALSFLGRMHESAGRVTMAEQLYTEGLVPGRSCGDAPPLASLLVNLGRIAAARGDYARAVVLIQEGLDLVAELLYSGNAERGLALLHMANLARTQGDLATARARCVEAWSSRGTEVSS